MLVLKYDAAVAGAPSDYGNAVDWLETADGTRLQGFPKAEAGFFPPETALSDAVDTWLTARGSRSEPVVVMVHGYQFDPTNVLPGATDPDSPLSSIYGYPPAVNYHLSWLPLVGECDQNGDARTENAIAFCYKSEADASEYGGAGWVNNYQYAVFDQAPLAARALAAILVAVAGRAPLVRILAHSLGTRTTSQAIRLAGSQLPGRLDRVVLLDGAEFSVDAAASFAGCDFDVFSITNRSDAVLQLGGDQFCHPIRGNGTIGACTLGYDGLGGNDRWIELQLDHADLVTWFAAGNAPDGIRYTIDGRAEDASHPNADLNHWACYTNDGNRALVRDLLMRDEMTVARMVQLGAPGGTAAPLYGQFNDQPIPPTPQARADRQRLLAPDYGVSNTG